MVVLMVGQLAEHSVGLWADHLAAQRAVMRAGPRADHLAA